MHLTPLTPVKRMVRGKLISVMCLCLCLASTAWGARATANLTVRVEVKPRAKVVLEYHPDKIRFVSVGPASGAVSTKVQTNVPGYGISLIQTYELVPYEGGLAVSRISWEDPSHVRIQVYTLCIP